MIGDLVVADAVVHPYNLAEPNRNPEAADQLDAIFAAHELSMDEAHAEYRLTREEFFSDFSFEALAAAQFMESPVDVSIIHALPNLGFANDYVTDPRRVAALRDEHPARFKLYATVDTPTTSAAIAQLEWQVRELGVDGLKLYPAFFYGGQGEGWMLDGDDFAGPLLEAARDLGIRNVAVHKILWFPTAPRDVFALDDVGAALERFPDLNFQIVHAGVAFLEQTAALLAACPNLYLTLESTFAYVLVRPDKFAAVLGRLLAAAGSERLLFASGNNLMHPRPLVEAFASYELPAAVAEEHGVQISDADRRNILGANVLRLHGTEPEAARDAVAGDAFERGRAAGYAAPWSVLRS